MKMAQIVVETPLGNAQISENNGAICRFTLTRAPQTKAQETSLLRLAASQVEAYFAKDLQSFDLPLVPEGTPFQESVWKALCTIPYGVTWSYQELAEAIGNSKATRAAGSANGKNPIWIMIPCHRVIRASGNLGGYAGGLDVKRALLELEGSLQPEPLLSF